MVNIDLIKEKLPQELRDKAQEYTISDAFLSNFAELIVLVLNSKSIDTKEEKQSWFNLLPMMSQEQIDKLKDILVREKQKLEEIEQKYEQKKNDIKNQYVEKFNEGGYKKTMVKIQERENAHQEAADQAADDLLTQI